MTLRRPTPASGSGSWRAAARGGVARYARWLPLAVCAVLIALMAAVWMVLMRMPGDNYSGPVPPLEDEPQLERQLRVDVERLVSFGARHVGAPRQLHASGQWIASELSGAGYRVSRQSFEVAGVECSNFVAELPGRGDGIIVVGAHYDTEPQTPGADDNASGVAAMLSLARHFSGRQNFERRLRFVAFVNEEMPHFYTGNMGSFQAARESKRLGETIVAMLSLESIGYYSTAPESQHYPPGVSWFYPSTGDFVGFVSNIRSRGLLRESIGAFRAAALIPSEGAALPELLPGVSWSDHWAYWKHGYPALMVTDTAPFRNPNYHRPSDTPETLDYLRMAHVVLGLRAVLEKLARP